MVIVNLFVQGSGIVNKKRFIFIEMEPVNIVVIIVITIKSLMNIEKGREEHPLLVDNYFFVLKGKTFRNIH